LFGFFFFKCVFLKDINQINEDFSDETDAENSLVFRSDLERKRKKECLDETTESLKSLDLNSEMLAQLSNSFETHQNIVHKSFQKIQYVRNINSMHF